MFFLQVFLFSAIFRRLFALAWAIYVIVVADCCLFSYVKNIFDFPSGQFHCRYIFLYICVQTSLGKFRRFIFSQAAQKLIWGKDWKCFFYMNRDIIHTYIMWNNSIVNQILRWLRYIYISCGIIGKWISCLNISNSINRCSLTLFINLRIIHKVNYHSTGSS